MPLTEHQILNTTAPSFDVQFRYFAGPDYGELARDGVLATLGTWVDPDIPLVGWTEITSRVAYASSFIQQLQGNSITWTAELSGWSYDDALLGLGLTVVCWRRFWRATGTDTAPAGWQFWERWYTGEIVSRNNRNNYQDGKPWTRTVTGVNHQLSSINAPRITTGRIRVTDGATVTGNDPLTQAEDERDQGEYVGGRANVALSNTVDGNRNTVYISDPVPAGAAHPFPTPISDGLLVTTEVFIKPYAGWSLARSWWVEVYNKRANTNESEVGFQCAIWNGGTPIYFTVSKANYWDPEFVRRWPKLQAGKSCIFCAHRGTFDELMGNAAGAAFIADLSQFSDGYLTDDAAVFAGNQIIAWSPGGANRHYEFPTWNSTQVFDGATLDSSALTTGQSWWSDTGNGVFTAIDIPHPGAHGTGDGPVWLKVVLPENVCQTLDEIDASATSIRLDRYVGWLKPPAGQIARGVDDLGHVFRWTHRDANGLHGVTWEVAPAAPLPVNTQMYPYANGEAQTGYPLRATHLYRRKAPLIESYRVYWSPYVARAYTETGWAADYYDHFHTVQGNVQELRLTDTLGDGATKYLWVRTILYLIDHMSDAGRAKVNEIEADLDQMALDLAGTPGLDSDNSFALAEYLWGTWAGLATGDLGDDSDGGSHRMGQHALAITPVDRVLDDLARATGCLVWYQPTGGATWLEDPWWPLNELAAASQYTFGAAAYRGDVEISQTPAQVDYVILNAVSLQDEPHSLRVVYPTPLGTTEPPVWALVREVNDRIVAADSDAGLVAQMELERLVLSNTRANLTITGPGEWVRPGMVVSLTFDATGAGSTQTRRWFVEQVRTVASQSGRQRRYETVLQVTGFRS